MGRQHRINPPPVCHPTFATSRQTTSISRNKPKNGSCNCKCVIYRATASRINRSINRVPTAEFSSLPHKELIGIASVDPQTHGAKAATAEAERAVKQLGLRGINVEPGFGNPPVAADDAQFLPVYDACAQLGVPLFIMSGPTTPNLEHTNPAAIGRIARQFPSLPICRLSRLLSLRERNNRHCLPLRKRPCCARHVHLPARRQPVCRGREWLPARPTVVGSSYPFRAMRQTVDDYLNLGFKDEVLDGVMYRNAERVLKLGRYAIE